MAVFFGANNVVCSIFYNLTTVKAGGEFPASSREKKTGSEGGAGRDEYGIFETGDRVTREG
jgi:hypothetical protein